nr:hypothetical protein [uncultured Niameybacter sp.]
MFINKVRKFEIFIVINIILATIIGICAQDITYYIVGDTLASTSLLYCLTIITVISIVLFLTLPLLIYNEIKKSKLSKRVFIKYLMVDAIIGSLTSVWSLFVLIMCWG